MNISYFFCGNAIVSVPLDKAAELLNLCMYYGINYTDFKACDDSVRLRFRLSSLKKLLPEAEARGICAQVISSSGIPVILSRYKHRYGIIVGFILAVALVFASQKIVWHIDVVGNERITSSEICAMLKDQGFGVGTYIPSVNTDRIENKILIDSDTVSWIAINISGTSATVEIREQDGPVEELVSLRPANLVASKSGLIEEVRIYRGLATVAKGSYVEAGDLLVSGLFDSERVGFRFTRAAGSVLARTTTEYFIEIPYEYTKKEYTGAEYYEKYLNFFDFSIKISKNSGNDEGFYDKIDIVENCCLPDGTQTPLSLRKVKYIEYENVKAYRSESEAESLAYFELSRTLADIADDSIIIRKQITPIIKDESFALQCTVVAIENIARISEFDVDTGIVDGKE